jgi:hypothetical protein
VAAKPENEVAERLKNFVRIEAERFQFQGACMPRRSTPGKAKNKIKLFDNEHD